MVFVEYFVKLCVIKGVVLIKVNECNGKVVVVV